MLELVVALAMAAVLTAYAVPAYFAYTARGHRIDAVIALHRAAQYVVANPARTGSAHTLPPGLDRSPEHGRAVYRLSWRPADDFNGGYEIQAIPIDDGPMRSDACGTFVLDGSGLRSNRSSHGGGASAKVCWAGQAA